MEGIVNIDLLENVTTKYRISKKSFDEWLDRKINDIGQKID